MNITNQSFIKGGLSTKKGIRQQGIAKSGGEVLRLDVFARLNFRSSIELLC